MIQSYDINKLRSEVQSYKHSYYFKNLIDFVVFIGAGLMIQHVLYVVYPDPAFVQLLMIFVGLSVMTGFVWCWSVNKASYEEKKDTLISQVRIRSNIKR